MMTVMNPTDTEPAWDGRDRAAAGPRPQIWPIGAPYRRGHRNRWFQVPGTLVYLILSTIIGWVGFAVILTLSITSVTLLVFTVGLFLWWLTLVVAGGFGQLERHLLVMTGLPQIQAPRRPQVPEDAGVFRRATAPSGDPHRWTTWVHAMLIAPILGTVTMTIALAWTASVLFSLTEWMWTWFWDFESGYQWLIGALPFISESTSQWAHSALAFLLGIAGLLALPWVVTGLADLHHGIARAMIGRWRSDDLADRAATAERSRGAAVTAEDSAVRRLERDLHDGPQQRLLRLQMDLAAIERLTGTDPERAKALAAEARQQGQETLEELRALVGGMAPPLLQDRGLAVALNALASRSTVPVLSRIDIPQSVVLPGGLERSAYFIVSELLTNVAKHAGADAAELSATTDPARGTLTIRVSDDGRGGAKVVTGRGLSGLQDRVSGLRGSWELDSIAGGPTTVTVVLPYRDGDADADADLDPDAASRAQRDGWGS